MSASTIVPAIRSIAAAVAVVLFAAATACAQDVAAPDSLVPSPTTKTLSAPERAIKNTRVFQKLIEPANSSPGCDYAAACLFTVTKVKGDRRLEVKHLSCIFAGSIPFSVYAVELISDGPKGGVANFWNPSSVTANATKNAYTLDTQTSMFVDSGQTLEVLVLPYGASATTLGCTVIGEMVTFK